MEMEEGPTISASAAATQAVSRIASLYCEALAMSRASVAGSSSPPMTSAARNASRIGVELLTKITEREFLKLTKCNPS